MQLGEPHTDLRRRALGQFRSSLATTSITYSWICLFNHSATAIDIEKQRYRISPYDSEAMVSSHQYLPRWRRRQMFPHIDLGKEESSVVFVPSSIKGVGKTSQESYGFVGFRYLVKAINGSARSHLCLAIPVCLYRCSLLWACSSQFLFHQGSICITIEAW